MNVLVPSGAVAPMMLKVAKGSKVESTEVICYYQPSPFDVCIISWPDVSSLLRNSYFPEQDPRTGLKDLIMGKSSL